MNAINLFAMDQVTIQRSLKARVLGMFFQMCIMYLNMQSFELFYISIVLYNMNIVLAYMYSCLIGYLLLIFKYLKFARGIKFS